jgi:hypothetical protein
VTPDGRVLVSVIARGDSARRWIAAGTSDTITLRDARRGPPTVWMAQTLAAPSSASSSRPSR